jgi:sulfite exporter TauE/SafE
MHTCHHHPSSPELIDIGIFSNFDSLAVIVTLFLMGLVGSFTHCIGMCGPIAVAQMSFRLINLPHSKLTQKEKFKCAMILPYYIGKALTYALLGAIVFYFSKKLSEIGFFRNVALVILIITGILFFLAALSKASSGVKLGWLNLNFKPIEL